MLTRVTIGTSILLIAAGAILKYAVTAHVSGIDIQTVGVILMLVGILGLIVGQGLTMALAGVGAGLIGALLASRLVRGWLFEIPAWDPATYLTIAAILGVVSLAASLVPARRAARTDPLVVLKGE